MNYFRFISGGVQIFLVAFLAYLQLNVGSAAHFPFFARSESPGFVNEHVEDWTDHIFVVQEIENPLHITHITTHVLI